MDAVQANLRVASGFPGVDFFLTEIQLQMLLAQFLEEHMTRDFYREHL